MLGIPVQVLQKQTTTKEFHQWAAYLEEKPNLFDPTHRYLAQIATVIANVNIGKGKKKATIEDFVLTFEMKKDSDVKKELTPEEKEKMIARSKQSWMAAVGMVGPKDKSKKAANKKTPPKKPTVTRKKAK